MSNFEPLPNPSYVTETQTTDLQQTFFAVRFWGVRGLIPTPSTSQERYGGNTACVEMFVAGKRLIFDGGTGLRILGKAWQQYQQPLEAHLFFTNSQSNRIQGFPFFAPAFTANNCFHIYGNAASNGASIKQCLYDQMLQPHFPYPLQLMQSELLFKNLMSGTVVTLDDVTITTGLINQTQKSIGYRINWQEYSVAYVTDLNPSADEAEQKRIIEFTQGADLLIANATYTELTPRNHLEADEYWQTGVNLAIASAAKRLVISHHHPDDDDDLLDKVQTKMKSVLEQAVLAREGLILNVV